MEVHNYDRGGLSRLTAILYMPGYICVFIYFLTTSLAVLISIKPSTTATTSAGARTQRVMSFYVFASALFMMFHLVSALTFLATNSSATKTVTGGVFLMYYVARSGTALCSVAIFHADSRAAPGSGFSKGGRKNYPTVFLESENARLGEQLKMQRDTQESRLKEERDFIASALHEIRLVV